MKRVILIFFCVSLCFSLFAQTRANLRKYHSGHFGLESFYDKETNLYGFKKSDRIVIEPKYIWVEQFSSKGFARVRTLRDGTNRDSIFQESMYILNPGLDGFIDTLGNVMIPIEFGVIGALDRSDIAEFTRGEIIDYKNGTGSGRSEKYGLINDKGEVVLEPTYDYIAPVTNTPPYLLFMSQNYICGKDIMHAKEFFINSQGEVLAPNGKYDFMDYLGINGLFYVEKQGMAGVINDRLEVVLPLEHQITDREATKKRLLEICHAKKRF